MPMQQQQGIVSIDYCADQIVTQLVDRDRIKAVSTEADSDPDYIAPLAKGLPRIRPRLESILAQHPAIVVKSYAGSTALAGQLRRLGISVIELGYPQNIDQIGDETRRIAVTLGEAKRGDMLVAKLGSTNSATAPKGTALYLTPGNVTAGTGTMIDDIIQRGGWRNYATRSSWHALPTERLVADKPDVVITAFFDRTHQQDHWAASRHLAVTRAINHVRHINLPGGSVACQNILAADAIRILKAAP